MMSLKQLEKKLETLLEEIDSHGHHASMSDICFDLKIEIENIEDEIKAMKDAGKRYYDNAW